MIFVVLVKAAIDACVAIGVVWESPAMALMFWGFFIADLGSAWMLARP